MSQGIGIYNTLLLPCGRRRLLQRRGRVFACRSSDVVECLPVDPATCVRFPAGADKIFSIYDM